MSKKIVKLFVPVVLIATLVLLFWGTNKVRHIVNQATAKSADITLPKVDEEALASIHARSSAGYFDVKSEVSNTRDNPFDHYGGYISPTAPAESAPATEPTTTPTGSTTTSATTTSSSTTSPTTGTTNIESSGGEKLPNLPPDLKQAGF